MLDKEGHQFVSITKEVTAKTKVSVFSLTTIKSVVKKSVGTLTARRDTPKLANFMQDMVTVGGRKDVHISLKSHTISTK